MQRLLSPDHLRRNEALVVLEENRERLQISAGPGGLGQLRVARRGLLHFLERAIGLRLAAARISLIALILGIVALTTSRHLRIPVVWFDVIDHIAHHNGTQRIVPHTEGAAVGDALQRPCPMQ